MFHCMFKKKTKLYFILFYFIFFTIFCLYYYDIQYSYQIQIICKPLDGFKYS